MFTRLILNKRKQFVTGNDAVHKGLVLTINYVESNITVRLLSQCIFLNKSLLHHLNLLIHGKRITHYIFSLS